MRSQARAPLPNKPLQRLTAKRSADRRTRPSIEIVGDIAGEEVIAIGETIREIERLRKVYGRGRWRKMKGVASFASQMEHLLPLRYTGTRVTASAGKNSRSSAYWAYCDEKTKHNE